MADLLRFLTIEDLTVACPLFAMSLRQTGVVDLGETETEVDLRR